MMAVFIYVTGCISLVINCCVAHCIVRFATQLSPGSCPTNQRQYLQAMIRVPRTNPYQLYPEEMGLTV